MKYVFLIVGIALAILAYFTPMIIGQDRNDTQATITWVTDINPERQKQISLFNEWRKKNNKDEIRVLLDPQNKNAQKIVVHGVTGVAGDIIDMFGFGERSLFHKIGLMRDLTQVAAKRGFDLENTYPELRPLLILDGEQIAYPANVATWALFINEDAFTRVGMEPIGSEGFKSFEEFEKMGSEYVQRANRGEKSRKYFFISGLKELYIARSVGLDIYNETLTGPYTNRAAWNKYMDTYDRWLNELHLIPTQAEMASFSTEDGYGGELLQLFRNGNFATIANGRWSFIQFREFSDLPNMSVVDFSFMPVPVTEIGTRSTFVYEGSENQELSLDFIEFLASEEYNLNIVESVDGLPPNPKYTKSEQFLRPANHPEEWGLHEAFISDDVYYLANIESPYHAPNTGFRNAWKGLGRWVHGLETREDAIDLGFKHLQGSIDEFIAEADKATQKEYSDMLAIQKKIDELKATGQKIPAEYIQNPYFEILYEVEGRLEK